MKLTPWLASCALAGGMLGSPAVAQPPPSSSSPSASPHDSRSVTLAAAVDAAWQRAVAARETHGQRQRAQAERSAASSLWAAPPALELSHSDGRWSGQAGRRETEVGLAWPLWLPGQRAARAAAADAAIAAADQAQSAERLRIAGEVREAAWAIFAQQAELVQADAQVQVLAALAEDVERRVRAGNLARADALAARAELLSATVQQAEARQRLLAARSRWAVLTGLDALLLAEEPQAAATSAQPPAMHPKLRLAVLDVERARKRLELLQASRRDAPELTVSMRHDVPGRAEPAEKGITLGLRLPLGTDDRNQPLLAAAQAELDVAEVSEQRLRERLDADAAAARAELQAAEQQLSAERSRQALLRERAQLIEKSFRAGESPLSELLRAQASAAEADAAIARQQAALGLARARLQQALGLLP